MAKNFTIYSDGGAELGHSAAGACIVVDEQRHTTLNVAAFLGVGTNNEAEIAASLVGFSYIKSIVESGNKVNVKWVSDSEYALKSATAYIHTWQKNGWKTANKKPVKNQGLWQTYLILSEGLSITAEHVRGHTGHPENEACDEASNWARAEAPQLLELQREGEFFSVAGASWMLLDGVEFLNRMRAEIFNPEDSQYFIKKFKTFKSETPYKESSVLQLSQEKASATEDILKELKDVLSSIERKLKLKSSPLLSELSNDLSKLIKKHSK